MQAPAKTKKPSVPLYVLTEAFERLVIFALASSPSGWALVGAEVEADAFREGAPRDIARILVMYAKEHGRGPGSAQVLLQRMRRHMDDGLQTQAELDAAVDLIIEADTGADADEVIAEFVPVVRNRLRQRIALEVADAHGKGKPFKEAQALMSRLESFGKVSTSLGLELTQANVEAALTEVNNLDRMPTGISELDQLLNGGVLRGDLGSFWGSPSAGKSMALYHMGISCAKRGGLVVIATLELGREKIISRLVANATGISIDATLANPKASAEAYSDFGLAIQVEDFPPMISTFDDIERWVAAVEDKRGRKVDLLLTDYADKLSPAASWSKRSGTKSSGSYDAMQQVYEHMRLYTYERGIFHMTGTQTKRREKGDKTLISLEDGSDSQHKARVLDLIVGMNTDDERKNIIWNVPKRRNGETGAKSGSIAADFARGRVCIVDDSELITKTQRERQAAPGEW